MLFRDLGAFRVEVDELEVSLTGKRQRSVLALLVSRVGRSVTPDALIEATWGDRPPARAQQALETVVWRLRSVLEPGRASRTTATLLQTDAMGYRLDVPPTSVDSQRFTSIAPEAVSALAAGDAATALLVSGEALSLWRGDPYATVPEAGWMAPVREELARCRLDLSQCHVQALLETDQPEQAVRALGPLLADHPFRERFWVQRMVALYRAGRQADALATYVEARRVLDEELGVEPGPELRRVHEQVLAQAAVLDRGSTPPSLETVVVPGHLPLRRVGLVGRQSEVEAVDARLDAARLVTLTGPGGVGKTRLAVEVAHRRRARHLDGVWFVDLSGIATQDGTAERVAQEVAEVLTLAARPQTVATDLLRGHLATRQLLLLLDNCEHVVDGVAALVELLMVECPGVVCLATSREALDLVEERRHEVGSLTDSDAVDLFTQRLADLRPDLDPRGADRGVIEGICTAVGGLPLGIELAAARARVFELTEVATSLEDGYADSDGLRTRGRRPDRQASLLDTVEWSYQLASEEEQALHRRLATIPGEVTLQAASVLCAVPPLTVERTAELLAGLVHRSLLTSSRPTRPGGVTLFRQLVPTRTHADRLLRPDERSAVTTARDTWVCAAVRQAGLDGRRAQAQGSAWVEDNTAAVRATLSSVLLGSQAIDGLELVVRLMQYWFERGRMLEALRWCAAALEGVDDGRLSGFAATLALATDACARALVQDRTAPARVLPGLLAELRHPPEEHAHLAGELLVLVAVSTWVCQQPSTGLTAAQAAAELGDRLRAPHISMRAQALRAMHLLVSGAPEQATAITAQILADDQDNQFAVFVAAYTNAIAARDVAEPAAGLGWMRRLAQAHRTLSMHPTSELLEDLALLLADAGSPAEALRCYSTAAALHARDGLPWPRLPHSVPVLERLAGQLRPADHQRQWAAGQRLARTDPVRLLDDWLGGEQPAPGRVGSTVDTGSRQPAARQA